MAPGRVALVLLFAFAACENGASRAPDAALVSGADAGVDAPLGSLADARDADAGSSIDAGVVAAFDCNGLLDARVPDLIVLAGNLCLNCAGASDPSSDSQCASLAGPLADGCRAYCRRDGYGACFQRCAGQCHPLAMSCHPGQRQCEFLFGIQMCDPNCGDAGACRQCVFDDECAAELGPGAECQRHCGTCCRRGADAGVPCLCI
jgi:hypothetical protein